MKSNLEDVTFLIPVRIDSVSRIENILNVITFLHSHFKTNFMVLEAAYYNNNILKRLLPNYVEFIFIEDKDPIFYRTYYLNIMCKRVNTPYLAIWDADVIVPPIQILHSVNQLRSNKADIAYPYNGTFLDTSEIMRRLFMKTKKISILLKHKEKMSLLYGGCNMKGGGLLVNKEKYVAAGMENENFYGWGPEDFERYDRWKTFKYVIYQSDGVMFHLTHPRDVNGKFNSQAQQSISNMELVSTKNSSIQELRTHLDLTIM